MPVYRRVFVAEEVAEVHLLFGRLIALAEKNELARLRAGRRATAGAATAAVARKAYLEFNRELRQLERQTAINATKAIRQRLNARRKRPDTGTGTHLRDAIVCTPIRDFGALATGSVGIADIARLDAVVNPYGPQYGPYWRAIEEGTRRHLGRQISGAFFGAGGQGPPSAPDPAQFRVHPVFLTTAQRRTSGAVGPRGGTSGRRMTIRRPIEAQHFIRDGANEAEIAWRAGLDRIQLNAERRLAAIFRTP